MLVSDQIPDDWQEVIANLPENALPVLQTLAGKGVTDLKQIMDANDFTRDRAERALKKLLSQGVLRLHPKPLARPDQSGKPTKIYLLTKKGVNILRALGHDTHDVNLQEEIALLHALGMNDIHLAALRAQVGIATDHALEFNGRQIRPDHLVSLPDGRSLIIEVEQAAGPETLSRIIESVLNKQEFFTSKAHVQILPEVRMVVQLRRNAQWDKTLRTWRNALNVVKEKKALSFRLFAIPRTEFLAAPDWGEARALDWVEISPAEEKSAPALTANPVMQRMLERSRHEDRVLLSALLQEFEERVQPEREFFWADPEFLFIMRDIYFASHREGISLREAASIPHASLFMLKEYIRLCKIHEKLNAAINEGSTSTRWNPTMALHRMQAVINTFVFWHGWRSNGPLLAVAVMGNWNKTDTHNFDIVVKIRNPQVLMADDDLVPPSEKEVRQCEEALAWALYALFEYNEYLGFHKPEFW